MKKALPLSGKKIAVLMETEYVPAEIDAYIAQFTARGAQVDLMSRLWGNKKLTFVSDVDSFAGSLAETQKKLEVQDVDIDFGNVNANDYAAVLVAANYCSVRLRYFEAPAGKSITPDMVRTAPAVKFFGKAMQNPRIVKGALCHALWLLTPSPELLAGRRVICNPVVIADIVNAGATYVPSITDKKDATEQCPAVGVVVDGDLVTGDSFHRAAGVNVDPSNPNSPLEYPYIDAITNAILRIKKLPPDRPTPPVASGSSRGSKSRRILIVLSERGYWGEELIGPLDTFDANKYTVEFATPTGKRPSALPPSMDPDYIDPPLNRPVVSEEMAKKTRAIDDTSLPRTAQSKRLDHPRSLAAWIPERPYWSHPNFVRVMEAYNRGLLQLARDIEAYDGMLIVGGSGPIVDLVNNQRVHDLILAFYRAGKPIGAECYGVPCLAFARDPVERKSIIWGKNVTGHCLEYDYKDGTGFMGTDFNMGPPPYPLEYILRDATGPDGAYHGNFGKVTSVIVDYPFITGRSTPDSVMTGQKFVEVLEHGLKRFGW